MGVAAAQTLAAALAQPHLEVFEQAAISLYTPGVVALAASKVVGGGGRMAVMRPSAQPSCNVRQIECAQASVLDEAVEVVNAVHRMVRSGVGVAVSLFARWRCRSCG